jgi:photoactive yellow protein
MGRVLVLEDDDDVAEMVGVVLQLDGHEVEHTASGRDAVLSVARGGWDLVITDLEVYELSGLGASRAIRDLGDVPVLAMSAGGGNWELEAFRAGAAACLQKPFDMLQLRALVTELLGRRGEPAGAGRVEPLSEHDLERLRALDAAELDRLPFGIIQVDEAGIIVGFNAYESAAAQLAPDAVLGRRFVDVAPCTRVKVFAEAVRDGFARRQLDTVLRFIFPSHGGQSVVAVRLYYDSSRRRVWIFVSRRAQPGGLARPWTWHAQPVEHGAY